MQIDVVGYLELYCILDYVMYLQLDSFLNFQNCSAV